VIAVRRRQRTNYRLQLPASDRTHADDRTGTSGRQESKIHSRQRNVKALRRKRPVHVSRHCPEIYVVEVSNRVKNHIRWNIRIAELQTPMNRISKYVANDGARVFYGYPGNPARVSCVLSRVDFRKESSWIDGLALQQRPNGIQQSVHVGGGLCVRVIAVTGG
jgi:hypothetical protein